MGKCEECEHDANTALPYRNGCGKYTWDKDANTVSRCEDLLEWGKWMADRQNRRVAVDHIGPHRVSTVFLGLDHSFGDGPPVLWETMIFREPEGGKSFEGYEERYTTLADALQGRKHACELARRPGVV